ncbi:MAG: energy transducer TonB [Deltaproteobacteria bacterium]|nr:energy transducer TonB [Deltaproteobacteria bacterium]
MFKDFQRARDWRAVGFFAVAIVGASTMVGSAIAYAWVRGLQPAPPPEEEEEVVVEFAPPPEPEPEPEPEMIEPPPEPQAVFRPAAVRPQIVTPTEIPDEELEESDEQLVEAEDTGPVGGDTRGVPGGTGSGTATPPPPPPPPPPEPERRERRDVRVSMENTRPPRQIGGPRSLNLPREIRSLGIQGVAIVQLLIGVDGKIKRFNIVRTPNDELIRPAIREWVMNSSIVFEPARRNDGTAVPMLVTQPFRIDARNL